MANQNRLNKAVGRLSSLLQKNPKGAKQVSTSSLEAVAGYSGPSAAPNITARHELEGRAASGNYETPTSQSMGQTYDRQAVKAKKQNVGHR